MTNRYNFPNPLRAALIDMDGVLYDSMPKHAQAYADMFAENGIATEPDRFFLYEGMTGVATIALVIKELTGREISTEEARRLYARKTELFARSGRVDAMPGASRMLETLRRADVKCVLVTGSAQSSLLQRLDLDFPGIFLPSDRITALDVVNGKPHPEPYLRGLALAGTAPEETIVIENALLGVEAGRAAGLFTCAVTTGPIPADRFRERDASLISPSMNDFADTLTSLLCPE